MKTNANTVKHTSSRNEAAIQLGRKLTGDPDAERFTNDEIANRLLSRPRRSPWHL